MKIKKLFLIDRIVLYIKILPKGSKSLTYHVFTVFVNIKY